MNGSRWSSRKWWAFLITEGAGILTTLGAYMMGEKEIGFAGLAMMIAAAGGYWKAEKDVDMARAEVDAAELYHLRHYKECQHEEK